MSVEVSISESLSVDGLAFVRDTDVRTLVRLANHIGQPRADIRDADVLKNISPRHAEIARPNTLSSRFGLGTFPPHTDAAYWREPATYLFLRCEHPGSSARPTLIWDTNAWNLSRSARELLCRAIWTVRARKSFLAPVAQISEGRLLFRFDEACMTPTSPSAPAAQRLVHSLLQDMSPRIIQWSRGDLLVLDNTRHIHARGEANVPDEDRVLQRMLVWRKR